MQKKIYKEKGQIEMKSSKLFIALLGIVVLILGILPASAMSGAMNNNSNPHLITLPTSGYGGNKVAHRYDIELANYWADADGNYRWHTLSGNNDVLHACNALKFETDVRIIINDVNDGYNVENVTSVFYGDDMSTTNPHTMPNCYLTCQDVSHDASYRFKTVIRQLGYPSYIIISEGYTKTISPET